MRLLISGSRNWTDTKYIECILDKFDVDTLIHGGCWKGVDKICNDIALERGWKTEIYIANWDKYGRAAGPIRNKKMVMESNADFAVLFCKNKSSGTMNTLKHIENANIPYYLYEQ